MGADFDWSVEPSRQMLWTTKVTMTIAPPVKTCDVGASENSSHIHTGVNTVSSKKNMLTSADGR